MTTAAKLEIAVMVTDTATLPLPNQVIMIENVPPGQEATKIIPKANSAGTLKSHDNKQVASSKKINCATKPIAGALGSAINRVKSSFFNCRETPNIISAMATFITTKSALLKSISTPVMETLPYCFWLPLEAG